MNIKVLIVLLALGSTTRAYSYSSVLESGDTRAFFAPSGGQSNQLANSFGVPVYNPSAARTDLISQAEAQAAMAAYQQAEAQEQARAQMQATIAAYQQAEAQEQARTQALAQQQAAAAQAQQQQAALAQEQARSQATLAVYQQAEAQEQARAQAAIAAYQQAEAQEQARAQALAQQQAIAAYQQAEAQQEQVRSQALAAQQQAAVPTITRITVLQPIASTYSATQDVANAQLAAAQQAIANQQWTQPAPATSSNYGQQTGSNFRFDALSPSSSTFAAQPLAAVSAAPAPVAGTTSTGPLYSSQSTLASGLSGLTVAQLLSMFSGVGTSRAQPVSTSSSASSAASRQNGWYY